MGKHFLVALLGGLLVVGVSTAFADEPQLTDEEVLQAWGQVQTDVKMLADATTPKPTREFTPLTDAELQEISGAGVVGGVVPIFFPVQAYESMPANAQGKVDVLWPGGIRK